MMSIRGPMNGGLPGSTHAGTSVMRSGKDGGIGNGAERLMCGVVRESADE
jgi:hypothetical protein